MIPRQRKVAKVYTDWRAVLKSLIRLGYNKSKHAAQMFFDGIIFMLSGSILVQGTADKWITLYQSIPSIRTDFSKNFIR